MKMELYYMKHNLNISNRAINLIASALLSIMFVSAFLSYQNDSTTMDELAHIPAGYSYLSQKDFRINPEHPPLIKDFAALPLMLLNLNFPTDVSSWTEDVNGQWNLGWEFLYNSGNNPEQILFWSRLPMVITLVFLGWFLFFWIKKEFGNKIALFVLILFTFSPNFIAHGRLVTTDVGATLGFILATYFWLKFLKNPSKKNVIIAGLVFGFSMLLKFSLILLLPFFGIITLTYVLLNKKNLLKYLILSALVGLIGTIFVILPVYQFHVLDYPAERQLSDTKALLESSPIPVLKDIVVLMADKPVIRSLAQYFLGLMMATQRTIFGNTVYFMNMVSASGWWYYFPVVYFLKVPLSFHIFTLISLLSTLLVIKRPFWVKTIARTKECIQNNFTAFSMMMFILVYWAASVIGNLNIGLRHILPVFPFTYVLVSLGLVYGIERIQSLKLKNAVNWLVIMLLGWYMISSLNTYPYYLSYFNELSGGVDNGYKHVVDSNYDWGQDLKRLAQYIEKNNIEKIKVDYFGGGDLHYYLGDKWEGLDRHEPNQKGWLAISTTHLQGGKGYPVHGFNQSTQYYRWLDNYIPVARAGKSIFIYNIPENSFVLEGR